MEQQIITIFGNKLKVIDDDGTWEKNCPKCFIDLKECYKWNKIMGQYPCTRIIAGNNTVFRVNTCHFELITD